jgi:hypothetical protein
MIHNIFDFDGTLISELKIDYIDLKDKLINILKCKNMNLSPMIPKIYNLSNKNKKIINKCFKLIDKYEKDALTDSNININILKLYMNSKYKIIVSRNGLDVINEFFKKNNIPYPDLICCRNNCKYLKPDTNHLNLVFTTYKELKNDNICIIGDSWHDKELAKNINCSYLDANLIIPDNTL